MPQPPIRQFALRQTTALLRKFSGNVARLAEEADAEAIHDLRVSIRRLSRCLREFSLFYPAKVWRPIRSQLRDLMQLAGTVRDYDIALELLEKAGVAQGAPIARQIQAERRQAGQGLMTEARLWKAQSVARQWKKQLEL